VHDPVTLTEKGKKGKVAQFYGALNNDRYL